MKGGLRKVGWVWTKTGWKRVPKRSRAVKKVPLPTKRRPLKIQRIAAAPKRTKPATPEAPELAAGQGRAVFAPTLAPEPSTPAPRPPRKAWSGKYAELDRASRKQMTTKFIYMDEQYVDPKTHRGGQGSKRR